MRLFIAVNFNESIKDSLNETIERLKLHAFQGSFTYPENLHLTLIFLGEVNHNEIDNVTLAMKRVIAKRFTLTMGGLGHFVRDDGDIYWIGIDRCETLLSIQNQLKEELIKEGFNIEDRKFKAHITLGRRIRLNRQCDITEFTKSMSTIKADVSKISLMKSERIKNRLIYTEIYAKELEI